MLRRGIDAPPAEVDDTEQILALIMEENSCWGECSLWVAKDVCRSLLLLDIYR